MTVKCYKCDSEQELNEYEIESDDIDYVVEAIYIYAKCLNCNTDLIININWDTDRVYVSLDV